MSDRMRIGVDIGSTTIKIVLLNNHNEVIYSTYTRHYADIKNTLMQTLREAKEFIGDRPFLCTLTGSGGMGIAQQVGLNFVQEVIASTKAVQSYNPETDVVIELGGEDAKITYLGDDLEQRMNGTCAGGTGAFIDQMASLLNVDGDELNRLAKDYKHIFPIAARCGVFAKTDIQPLINEGARKEDIAISIFHAVVVQTISVLACGREIKGKVAFLGGPLTFLSELRQRFIDVLGLEEENIIFPNHSELYVALGAALLCEGKEWHYATLIEALDEKETAQLEKEGCLPRLFEDEEEYKKFSLRHSQYQVSEKNIKEATGKCYLGIDAGSTTTKAILLNEQHEVIYSYYASNKGNPIETTKALLKEIYAKLPEDATIVKAGVTGYGETLLKEVFSLDCGEIETIAHYTAAKFFCHEVDFILDIGGQDMKCLKVRDGVIQSITLNEACSAGCGSFLQAFANAIGLEIQDFAERALFAEHPVDLGSKCTVFMNSKVKQAQKEGFSVEDIAAGLAYSVVKNTLYKVIKLRNPEELGKHIVVQGGTFYNEAVLRAFELLSEQEVIRPNISGLMGAFGMALIAKEKAEQEEGTLLAGPEELDDIEIKVSRVRCKACSNQCMLSVNKLHNGKQLISGNRCEKPIKAKGPSHKLPNMYRYKYERLFAYEPLSEQEATRGTIGIPRVLNMYENYPFWFKFWTELGFRVVLSDESSKKMYEQGIHSIVSETVCYPAKLVHGHIENLISKGIKRIFYPCVIFEQKENMQADNCFNCPVVTSYSEVISNNVDGLERENVQYINPFISFKDVAALRKGLRDTIKSLGIGEIELSMALRKAWQEQDSFKSLIRQQGELVLRQIEEEGLKGIVLAGRPYHVDPEINHGIPELINSLGMAVLTEDSLMHLGGLESPLEVIDQWVYHSRLYQAASCVKDQPTLELVQLTSFGCGLDAITSEQVEAILKETDKMYTNIKIDEGSNLGAIRIRLRSLKAAMARRSTRTLKKSIIIKKASRVLTKADVEKTTLLVPQFSPIHFGILQGMLKHHGYNIVLLNNEEDIVEKGLKYIHNDLCYPAVVVIGQIIDALQSGEYDLNNTKILLAQTEGQCRFSNYIKILEKAMVQAGFEGIDVLSLNLAGVSKDNRLPGLNKEILEKGIVGVIYGDLLTKVLYRTRPYEKIAGSADALYEKWKEKCIASLSKAANVHFKENVEGIIADFTALPLNDVEKPKVGIVGELLVKFNPIANKQMVQFLESEGVEVVVNDLLTLLLATGQNKMFNSKHIEGHIGDFIKAKIGIKFIERYQKVYQQAVAKSELFYTPETIGEMAENASVILSQGNQSGEGWKLAAEILELYSWGVKHVVCMQPFGCLPAHTTARGSFKKLKRYHNDLNIVPIEYDPGSSEVNQINRTKLMLAKAFNKI